MDGYAREICLKSFDFRGQAVYNGVKTTPSLTVAGSNKSFLTANQYTLAYGRNINDEDVAFSRSVIVVGKMIQKRLFPHESPIGKTIKLSGHTFTIIGGAGGKRHGVRSEPGRHLRDPDHPFFRKFRRSESDG